MSKSFWIFLLLSGFVSILVLGFRYFLYTPDTKIFPEQWEGEYKDAVSYFSLTIWEKGNEWGWLIENADKTPLLYFFIRQEGSYWKVCTKGGACYYEVAHNNNSFAFEDNSNISGPHVRDKFMVMPHYSFYRHDNGNITLTLRGWASWAAVEETVMSYDFVKQQ